MKESKNDKLDLMILQENLDKINILIGIIKEVANVLKKGYNERIYQNAIIYELSLKDISFTSEEMIPITYKDKYIGSERADIICDPKWLDIIIELKAVSAEIKEDALLQVLTYMKQKKYTFGLFVNFNQSIKKDLEYIVVVSQEESSYIYNMDENSATVLDDNYFK